MQSILDVDLYYIKEGIDRLLLEQNIILEKRNTKDSESKAIELDEIYYFTENELLTNWYFDNLIQELNPLLEEAGRVKVVDLAKEWVLPISLCVEIIKDRLPKKNNIELFEMHKPKLDLGTSIDGENKTVYSSRYQTSIE